MIKPSKIKMIITMLMVLLAVTLFTSPLSAGDDDTEALQFQYQFIPSPNYTQADSMALLQIDSGARTDVTWKDPQGKTVACHPTGGGCVIRNTYSSVGTLIATTHEFNIAGQQRTSGTYTAIASYCYPDPYIHACLGWTYMFTAQFDIREAVVTHVISGNAGVASATLRYVDDTTRTVAADGAGNYAITVPSDWSGTVTPFKPGYFFSPASRSYTNVLADQAAQDYTSWAITSQVYLPLAIR